MFGALTGDGSMIVRIDSLEQHDIYTKAGVMIRETLDANSVMAIATTHSNNNTALQCRTEAGGSATTVNESGTEDDAGQLPIWLKLTREGDTISAERSLDGESWEPIDPDADPSETEVTMSNTVYIGLYVCSRTATGDLSAATFYGVETTGSITGDWTIGSVGGDTEQPEGGNTIDELYIALEDNSGTRHDVYAPVITAVGWGNWYEWVIPQSEFTSNGVDMTSVKKIIVGVGDPSDPMKGEGLIFLDDIGYGRALVEP
jgi:regulation of enolase protein 1 (concanavalin A-like superfamily)